MEVYESTKNLKSIVVDCQNESVILSTQTNTHKGLKMEKQINITSKSLKPLADKLGLEVKERSFNCYDVHCVGCESPNWSSYSLADVLKILIGEVPKR
jgi:hypothetical protein